MKVLFLFVCVIMTQLSFADISLSELGMKSDPAQDPPTLLPKESLKLRTNKLKTHEMLGLVTLGTMTATLLTGNSVYDNDMHMYLGFATGALYMATAYYSLTAPKPMGVVDRGRIKWHKNLAWVHFPLMILVPYIGYRYKKNEEDGNKHSGLEKQHRTLAGILYGSFAISAALMVVEF